MENKDVVSKRRAEVTRKVIERIALLKIQHYRLNDTVPKYLAKCKQLASKKSS